MADSPAPQPADPRLEAANRLVALLILVGARRVRAVFAARIADPAADPRERSRMRRLLADYPQTPGQRSRP